MIKQWWETITGLLWRKQYDDRIAFNIAQRYVQAVERRDREAAERLAAGVKIPWRKRNQQALRVALDLMYRRVPDKMGSSASIGGCYRTMTDDEFSGSDRERQAEARYEALISIVNI